MLTTARVHVCVQAYRIMSQMLLGELEANKVGDGEHIMSLGEVKDGPLCPCPPAPHRNFGSQRELVVSQRVGTASSPHLCIS